MGLVVPRAGPAWWDAGTAIGPCCFWGLGRLEDDAASQEEVSG